MISFEVKDMTCGHCVSTITKALKAVDNGARVQIDLASHLVQIEPGEADQAELADAIKEAGYTPVAVATGAVNAPAATGNGCCCSRA
ncbi:heavy-metal-associated domain-containing protein [Roseateles toxinivorans]|uniref:Copper chaperone n=1 Tax=Roseateles toxinivorans TaxID=270368 RepID=A0A4R6QIC8_9BURK|nr:heavy-metal-associated domain-containing protein [Roseateles toxinivorans]TDP63104.1 copper chaperone [Roseateles toxinivorans]